MLLINLAISLCSIVKVKTLECVSVINEKCMSIPKIINLNADELVFYLLSIKVNKRGGDCNNINDPMAKLCVPDVVKDMNIEVFNLLARINETRKVVWHETCNCVYRLTSAVCSDRQEWNENKCRCECKEDLINKLVCDKGYMWNPSACSCECDRYCTSIVDLEIKNNTLSKKNDESYSNIYFILFIIFLVLFVLFLAGFIYYWRKENTKNISKKLYYVIYPNTKF